MRDRRAIWTAITVLIAIGIGLRTWNITTEPMWLDEAYSAYAADHGFAFLWHVVPLYESHPPFYYSLLHLWVLAFGNSVAALRLLGWFAGIATLPVLALVADQAGRWIDWGAERRSALRLATVGLASLSLALVEMTREIRPYPLMILCYAGAIGLIVRLARRACEDRPVAGRAFAAYLILLETLLWLHNLGALYGLALTLALAIALPLRGLGRRDWLWLIVGHILVAATYVPCLMILRQQAATWTVHTWLQFHLDWGLIDHLMTLYGVPGWIGLASLLLSGLAVATLVRAQNGARLAAMLLVLALLPPLLAILLSMTVAPIFITRIFTAVAVPAVLLLAIGASATGRYRMLGVGAAVLLGASMLTAGILARLGPPMQDWYRTVDWLAAHFRPGDQVFAYPNEGKLPLFYALRDKGLSLPIRAIPTDVPALELRRGTHPTGTRGVSSLPPEELHAIAEEPATRSIPTIWLLRLGAETYDPGDVFLRELHRGRYVVRTWQDGPIDIIGLRKRPGRETVTPTEAGIAGDKKLR
jgi:mannosyltransferase